MVGALNDISWLKDAFREDGFSECEQLIEQNFKAKVEDVKPKHT